jgi:hypothetical protein
MIDVAKMAQLSFTDTERPDFVINDENTAKLADMFTQSRR